MVDLIGTDETWGEVRGKLNRSARRKSVLNRLLLAEARARGQNCRELDVMSVPPTITPLGSSPGSGWGTAYPFSTRPDLYAYDGGVPIQSSGWTLVRAAIGGTTGGSLGLNNGGEANGARFSTMISGTEALIRVRPTTNGYRFLVNDRFASLSPSFTTNSSGGSGAQEYFALSGLGVAGEPKKLTVELHKSAGFVWIATRPTDDIWKPEDRPLIFVHGDSTVQGATCDMYTDGWARVLADLMGADCVQSGIGGYAWQSGTVGYRFADQLAAGAAPANTALALVTASQNDNNKDTSAVFTSALSGLRALRAQLPDVPIGVLGALPGITGPSATCIAAETAVMSAFDTWNDDFSFKVPRLTATPYIIRGTKKPSDGDGKTTTEIYMDDLPAPDGGAHPSRKGHNFIGMRDKALVYTALRTLAAAY